MVDREQHQEADNIQEGVGWGGGEREYKHNLIHEGGGVSQVSLQEVESGCSGSGS